MARIEIDLSQLIFVGMEGTGAHFVDGDNDDIIFYVTGNAADHEAAVKEIMKVAVMP